MKRLTVLVLIVEAIWWNLSFAGQEAGNGGGAHLCTNGQVKMYDLIEGEIRYGHNILEFEKLNVDQILEIVAQRLNQGSSTLYKLFQTELVNVRRMIKFSDNIRLERVFDADILLTKRGCEYRQLANWDDLSGNIFVDKILFLEMSEIDQAALYVHEVLYKIARDGGAINSNRVRKFVSDLFSGHELDFKVFETVLIAGPRKVRYICSISSNLLHLKDGLPFKVYNGFDGLKLIGLSGSILTNMEFSVNNKQVLWPMNYFSYRESIGDVISIDFSLKRDSSFGEEYAQVIYNLILTTYNSGEQKKTTYSGMFYPNVNISVFDAYGTEAVVVESISGKSKFNIYGMSFRCDEKMKK